MSLTSTNIDTLIDANCGSNSTSYPISLKTIDKNLALDKAFAIIFQSDGKWQFDDTNHTDYPIITTNLVAGQRDYSFLSDENGNLILDIYKVQIKDESGKWHTIATVDQQSEDTGITDGNETQGTPTEYDKTANGIFLNDIPKYSSTGGLRVFINREASYFITTDTTKKPGFAGIFHEYVALRPSYFYASRKGLPNRNELKNDMLEMERDMRQYYGRREKDTTKRMIAMSQNNH